MDVCVYAEARGPLLPSEPSQSAGRTLLSQCLCPTQLTVALSSWKEMSSVLRFGRIILCINLQQVLAGCMDRVEPQPSPNSCA